jgi:hypothetical protein
MKGDDKQMNQRWIHVFTIGELSHIIQEELMGNFDVCIVLWEWKNKRYKCKYCKSFHAIGFEIPLLNKVNFGYIHNANITCKNCCHCNIWILSKTQNHGHNEPTPTSAPWRMNGKRLGNIFLLGSSTLTNHGS